MRILLAEDDAMLGTGMAKALTLAGFTVDWVRTGHWESKSQLAQKTLLNISQYDTQRWDFWPREILNQIFNNLAPNSLPEGNFAQSDLNFLADSFFDEASLQSMLTALRVKKNIILQGPPGTGKTFLAKRLAHALMGAAEADRITTVQFHQSYSYEDFIMGFRPCKEGFDLWFCKRIMNAKLSEPLCLLLLERIQQ